MLVGPVAAQAAVAAGAAVGDGLGRADRRPRYRAGGHVGLSPHSQVHRRPGATRGYWARMRGHCIGAQG